MTGGCGSQPVAERPTTTRPVSAVTQKGPAEPKDAPPALPIAFQVEVRLLSFPVGTYSKNEDFWKRIDEQCVDPATADLLYKNGMRVGVAPISEVDHFLKFVADVAPLQKFAMQGAEMRNAQFPMKGNLPLQRLFHYDRHHELIGRTFYGSENVLNVSFEPAVRKPGTMRLTICPMVRSSLQRPEYTMLNNELKFQYVNDEKLYDVNCKADIPRDSFLIITPSPDALRDTSIGNAFFMKDEPAEKREVVLLIIPRVLTLTQPKTP